MSTSDGSPSPSRPSGGRDFPEGFLWGSSTAAHQVEGGNTNSDWWAWEHRPGSPAVEPSGDGIDHYHRYASDFALLASLGHDAHRLSLEWARIEPAPGEWSSAALEHYRRVLGSAQDHGLTVFATLQHFTLPRWFAEQGGWLAPDAVARFGEYASRVTDALGDLTPFVCTINEPSVAASYGHRLGQFPPGLADPVAARTVTEVQIEAHREAVAAVKAASSGTAVGMCLALATLEPVRPDDPACVELCRTLEREQFHPYLDDPAGDFLGVQYYTRWRIDPHAPDGRAAPPAATRTTQMGWEVHPEGLREVLHLAARTGLPLFVTENGIATDDDAERSAFVTAHLEQVRRALDEGVDVRGYFYWSAFDNFEWNDGYRPTFGLVGIDRGAGLRRVVRGSAVEYGRIARTGRLRP